MGLPLLKLLHKRDGADKFIEDDDHSPIDARVGGFAFQDGKILVDTGPFSEVHRFNGFKLNERGAVYCAVGVPRSRVFLSIPLSEDGRVIIRPSKHLNTTK